MLLFGPIYSHELIYDGVAIVGDDSRLDDPVFGLTVWTQQWWEDGALVPISRPLTQFTYWLQVQLHGRSDDMLYGGEFNAFHAVDLVLYAGLCALVALVTGRLVSYSLSLWESAGPRKSAKAKARRSGPARTVRSDVRASPDLQREGILAAWLVGPAFAVHPLHTEVVASVVGRADTLSLIFTLLGMLWWITWRRDAWTWRPATVIAACVLLGGLSKEPGYLLAPMLVLMELGLRRLERRPIWESNRVPPHAPEGASGGSRKKSSQLAEDGQAVAPDRKVWHVTVAICVVVVIAFTQRQVMKASNEESLTGPPAAVDNPLVDSSRGERVITSFKLLSTASRMLIWPAMVNPYPSEALPIRPASSPDYSPRMLMPTSDLADPAVLVGLAIVVIWLLLTIHAWRCRRSWLPWLLIIPITFLIPSNVPVIIGTVFAERLLLAFSFFALLAPAAILVTYLSAKRKQQVVTVMLVLWVCFLAAMSFLYLPAWRDNTSLSAYTVSYHPRSGRFQGFWANDALSRGVAHPEQREMFFAEAEARAKQAIELWPEFSDPYSVLGIIAYHRGNHQQAQQYLRYAHQVDGRAGLAEYYLHQLGELEDPAQWDQETEQLEVRLKNQPDDQQTKLRLAMLYSLQKRHVKAAQIIRQIDITTVKEIDILDQLLRSVIYVADIDTTMGIYQQQMNIKPNQWSILTDAALVLLAHHREIEQAKSYLLRAIELSPGASEPWGGMAAYWETKGNKPKALESLDEALRRCTLHDPKRAHYQLAIERLKKK